MRLNPQHILGNLRPDPAGAPVADATWYVAQKIGDGLAYEFPAGSVAAARYLTADFLVDGNHQVVFALDLQQGADGPTFRLTFAALNQCGGRIRMPLEALNQNRWMLEREGAWLKPLCGGDCVDAAGVDRMTLTVLRKSEEPARWCITAFTATENEPPLLTNPVLPKGALIDELGQSTLHDWPAKSRSAEEVTLCLHEQLSAASSHQWPDEFSRWGGWKVKQLEATGFFRTHYDDRRWWLVDPEGCVFWSAGPDCVSFRCPANHRLLHSALAWLPERDGDYASVHGEAHGAPSVDFLKANFIRAFGPEKAEAAWEQIALAELRGCGSTPLRTGRTGRLHVRPRFRMSARCRCVFQTRRWYFAIFPMYFIRRSRKTPPSLPGSLPRRGTIRR